MLIIKQYKSTTIILVTIPIMSFSLFGLFYLKFGLEYLKNIIKSDDYIAGMFININSSVLDYIVFGVIIALIQEAVSNRSRRKALLLQIENNRGVKKIEASSSTFSSINELRKHRIFEYNLDKCYFENVHFKEYFKMLKFTNAELQNIKFTELLVENLHFKSLEVYELKLTNTIIMNGKFDNCKFYKMPIGKNSFLKNIIIESIVFDNCNLSKVEFQFCVFKNVKFISCNLSNTKFIHCNLVNLTIDSTTLNRTEFIYCKGFNHDWIRRIEEKMKKGLIIKQDKLIDVEIKEKSS